MQFFIQISDLHYGVTPKWSVLGTPIHPKFAGAFGHDHAALRHHLMKFLNHFRRNDPDTMVLISGDLTSCGSEDQFLSIGNFLSRGYNAQTMIHEGLDIPTWSEQAIPGNHDHWGGRQLLVQASELPDLERR